MALVLLTGGGLLIRSLQQLQSAPLGFTPAGVLTMQLFLPMTRYPQGEQQAAFFDQLLVRIRRIPGVTAASVVTAVPYRGVDYTHRFEMEGPWPGSPGEYPTGQYRPVDPD